jgi:hypothetical protein
MTTYVIREKYFGYNDEVFMLRAIELPVFLIKRAS